MICDGSSLERGGLGTQHVPYLHDEGGGSNIEKPLTEMRVVMIMTLMEMCD